MLAFLIRVPVQALVDATGMVAEDGPNPWAPAICVGNPDGVPGIWLQPGPALTAVVI